MGCVHLTLLCTLSMYTWPVCNWSVYVLPVCMLLYIWPMYMWLMYIWSVCTYCNIHKTNVYMVDVCMCSVQLCMTTVCPQAPGGHVYWLTCEVWCLFWPQWPWSLLLWSVLYPCLLLLRTSYLGQCRTAQHGQCHTARHIAANLPLMVSQMSWNRSLPCS